MIDRRISRLSCNKREYDKAKEVHEKALNKSNVKITLNFNEKQSERKKKNRKSTLFNLPYNESVKKLILPPFPPSI